VDNLRESLIKWITKLSNPDNGPICPYAMKAWLNNEVVLEDDGKTIPDLIPLEDNVSVCVVPRIGIDYDDLVMICYCYNKLFPDYLFLDTHPDEELTLRGQKTVWEYPAIIIQKKDELLEARSNLIKIGFYKNWDLDLLKDLGIDF